jgi:uncharacterized protein (DUF1330 family)
MCGYWIVSGRSLGDAGAAQAYADLWKPIAEKFGAVFLAGPHGHTCKEGTDSERLFIVRFPSYTDAVECYESPQYQAALPHAARAYVRTLFIVPGH